MKSIALLVAVLLASPVLAQQRFSAGEINAVNRQMAERHEKEKGKPVPQAAPVAPVVTAPASTAMADPAASSQSVDQQRAEAAFDPRTCRFQWFARGDELGKTLAAAAKEECLSTKGQLGPAYARWRDHFQTNSAKRNSAALQAQQQGHEQIQQQQRNLQQQQQRPPSYSCRPSLVGRGMDCDPK